MGSHSPRSSNIRSFPESRSLFAKGTCRDHCDGDRGLDKRLCGTSSPFWPRRPDSSGGICSDKRLCVGPLLGRQTDIVAVQRKWYGQNWSFAYQWLLVMSTQLIGFSMGGVVKRFLVSPPSMSWSTLSFFGFLYHALIWMGSPDPSLASEPRHMCAFQHSPLSGLLGLSRQGNEP